MTRLYRAGSRQAKQQSSNKRLRSAIPVRRDRLGFLHFPLLRALVLSDASSVKKRQENQRMESDDASSHSKGSLDRGKDSQTPSHLVELPGSRLFRG